MPAEMAALTSYQPFPEKSNGPENMILVYICEYTENIRFCGNLLGNIPNLCGCLCVICLHFSPIRAILFSLRDPRKIIWEVKAMSAIKKVVLAYSGGLDTSIIIPG